MHLILVSNRLATAKTLYVTPRLMAGVLAGFLVASMTVSFALSWVSVRFNLPFVSDLVESVHRIQTRKSDEYVRENISTMAVKLGEMQAQLMRLDHLGDRVAKQSGVSLPKSDAVSKGGAGGPLVSPSRPFSVEELRREVDRVSLIVEDRVEALTALESQLMERQIKTTLLPTLMPINAEHVGSTFGSRVDPIAGVRAMHEGVDFVAEIGGKVIAAAGGVITVAEFHPQYGNMVEIDHGNDFTSRYAHLSRIGVRLGQVVKRGQELGRSGNTGRSTGPHLHFEVRFRGVAQNPSRFLQMGSLVVQPAKYEISSLAQKDVMPSSSGKLLPTVVK